MFSVSNLLDTVGSDHLEAKKGQVQLPGRSFNFLLRLLKLRKNIKKGFLLENSFIPIVKKILLMQF